LSEAKNRFPFSERSEENKNLESKNLYKKIYIYNKTNKKPRARVNRVCAGRARKQLCVGLSREARRSNQLHPGVRMFSLRSRFLLTNPTPMIQCCPSSPGVPGLASPRRFREARLPACLGERHSIQNQATHCCRRASGAGNPPLGFETMWALPVTAST
jgi:hypothetical protein